MAATSSERQDLLNWLGAGASVSNLPRVDQAFARRPLQVVRVTGSDQDRAVIVVPDYGAVEDFYAFVSTYVTSYSPFSSFFRVLTFEELQNCLRPRPEPNRVLARALVGAIICDRVFLSKDGSLDQLPLRDCLSSESFCMSKAIVSQGPYEVASVYRRWVACSRVLAGDFSSTDDSGKFWRTIDSLGRQALYIDSTVSDASQSLLRVILEQGEFNDVVWKAIAAVFPFINNCRDEMTSAREIRARAFTNLVRSKEVASLGNDADLAVGLLGALLAGGQVEYASLVSGLRQVFPNAARWFGFIVGCLRDTDILSAARSLGRHVFRELTRNDGIGEAISSDVAYGELRVLGGGKQGYPSLRARYGDMLTVELFPELVVFAAMGRPAQSAPVERESEFDQRVSEAKRLLDRASLLLGRIPGNNDVKPPPKKRTGSQKKLL